MAVPPSSAPAEAEFGAAVLPAFPRHRMVRRLQTLLDKCDPARPVVEQRDALTGLFEFLRSNRPLPGHKQTLVGEPQGARLELVIRSLEHFPFYRERVSGALFSLFAQSRGVPMFARLGLPSDRGFIAETVDRVARRFLPEPVDPRDLVQLLALLVPRREDVRVLSRLPVALPYRLCSLLQAAAPPGRDPFAPLGSALREGIALLALRISAVGLSEVIRARSPELKVTESPFFRLQHACDQLLQSIGSPAAAAQRDRCFELMNQCTQVLTAVVQNLEQKGVSIDVVYRLELAAAMLARLDVLLRLVTEEDDVERMGRAAGLLVNLAEARLRDRNLGEILRGNLHLMARKIIERAGHTGEHYITEGRSEYFKMLASAAGGGVLTAGTTALKFLVNWIHAAPFLEGLLASCNYAGSFLLMQFLGFTLATKQPSMTAAALAGSLRETASHPDLSGLVTTIARIVRSQLAAAAGNIGLVIPAAVLFDWGYRIRYGQAFLDAETAAYVVGSLHPTHSGTLPYAALTGVLLWASSIVAGWVENWAVYRRLPEAIAEHRYGRVVGRRTMRWLSRLFERNIAGIGGNTSLGVFLGMTPVVGKFVGLPLDVRHVTLSTGALTLAVCSLGADAGLGAIAAAAVGIVLIGSLNFGVSFVLALAVALRARTVERSDRLRLLWSVFVTFFRSPLQFFWPPASGAEPVHGPASIPPGPRSGH